MSLAGRTVAVEQRDPTLGPNSRLDIKELPNDAGGPASYDVSVRTVFRKDDAFLERCGEDPGHAAAVGFSDKLDRQYKHRLPGSRLVPLIVETGGRWHEAATRLLKVLARGYVARTPGLEAHAVGLVLDRWAARLSAILIRGNAAVVRARGAPYEAPAHVEEPGGPPLPHRLPEGDSAYELLV